MKNQSLTFLIALAALPLGWCQEQFDAVAALANLGLDVSGYGTEQSASLIGQDASSLAARSVVLGCKYSVRQCAALALLSGQVAYPNSSAYHLEESGYWSNCQAEVEPICIYQPSTSTGVSAAILLSRLTQCPFAVKSGGHAAFANASNIEGGITINLAKLNEIELSADKKLASLGPGNTWYDVYTTLEEYNATVIGGRVAAIGVGGLTLGGGISFFSNQYGWACDNVANYEVVTATGEIIDVSYNSSHRDLYYALRGGGNNFGIVTRFDLYAYPQGLMWGGATIYLIEESPALLDALYSFSNEASSDPNAALIVSYAYTEGQYLAVTELEYALPEANPPIFNAFLATPNISDTTAITSLSSLTVGLNESNPGGLRDTFWTATYKVDRDLMDNLVQEYQLQTNAILNVTNLVPTFSFQIITTDQLSHMGSDGGNALGLTEADGPLILLSVAFMWIDPADDETVLKACQNIVDNTVEYAKAKGLDHEYLYMNYASQYQNVVPSYNATNQARLAAVAKTYDPTGVFQTLQPGHFKLSGAPAGSVIG
ncbi:hypothetical protein LTR08_004366 [Meristemomyces frigidus]|nr:hypothetical protein LTR08_004366 [Meristemomyces frigidus]